MNILQINKKFGTQAKCLSYLQKLRWGKSVTCTYCGSDNTVSIKTQQGRHHCNNCKTTFSVIVGTIFEDTRLPLPKWFVVIGLMLNAKQGMSARQIMRNVGLTYKTAWYAAMRVRCAMIEHQHNLQNIVEMDEAYVGGKPRKSNKRLPLNKPSISTVTNKRGRGTKKTPIVGVVERGGKIELKVIEKLTSRNLLALLTKTINEENTILITDDNPSYKRFDDIVEHLTVKHKEQHTRGSVHTNTIDGFWTIVKNSIRGQYIAISKKYLPFYLVQAQYIYNVRNSKRNLFEEILRNAVKYDKCLIHYKPKKDVKDIVY